ncbi:MAG: UDP-N-acetylenolpyruvoylglucosamine reductase [Flavobacteriaceae bacterium]|nr:UDP-N-acetylenolpyruvoylglucosamine reductase [Flavobacteriaceae bacterium]
MIRKNISLKKYNSFNIDVNAKEFVEVNSKDELIEIANKTKDKNVLYLGGGSNILFTRDFDGIVIHLNIKGVQFEKTNSDETVVQANAGENWNNFVEFCIKNNLGGIENLSMILGNVGSAPVQNIGAYGVELKDIFLTCEVFNKNDFSIKTYNLEDCKFEYRNSIFKENKNLIILSVRLKLRNKNHKINSSYGGINDELKKLKISKPTIKDISNVVCSIRKRKLPDPKIIGNAGSFFKNPVVKKDKLEWIKKYFNDVPSYKLDDKNYKIPAAWLIESAGLKGKELDGFGIHKTQPLVLVNYGGAKGDDIYKLSLSIKEIIFKIFKIELETEVNII